MMTESKEAWIWPQICPCSAFYSISNVQGGLAVGGFTNKKTNKETFSDSPSDEKDVQVAQRGSTVFLNSVTA